MPMDDTYLSCVKGKTAEEILAQPRTSASDISTYLRVAAEIRSNQELIAELKQASEDSGKAATKIAFLTWALVFAAILQAVVGAWPYASWWIRTKFNVHLFFIRP
jgi:hypothetical protein